MPDLNNAIQALDRIPFVLGIKYSTVKSTCSIRVLKNSAKLRKKIAQVLKRYTTRYVIELVPRSKEHVRIVSQLTAEAKTNKLKKTGLPTRASRSAKKSK